MQVLIQRVREAACIIQRKKTAAIADGFLLFVSFHQSDTPDLIQKMVRKVSHLRIFEDERGKMNLSLKDKTNPTCLSISQFTLEADTQKGHRPSFTRAMGPEQAELYFTRFNDALGKEGVRIESGTFGAHMEIHSVNDGPVTIRLALHADEHGRVID